MNPQQKLVIANAALVLYYYMPNMSSFLLALTLIVLHFCPQCSFSSICQQEKCECSINECFNKYLSLPISRSN